MSAHQFILTKDRAKGLGYTPLTKGFLKTDVAALEAVVLDLELGRVDFILVMQADGLAIWLKPRAKPAAPVRSDMRS